MKVVYIAHPLGQGPDREANRLRAARWCGYLAKEFNIAPVADWIVLSSVWSEEDGRQLGLAIDVVLVQRCDEVWLVGGRISPGMAIEVAAAQAAGIKVIDMTDLGPEPPA
jgi:hypothetical protein